MSHDDDDNNTTRRGFAVMSAERHQQIARKGGQTAHQKGTAHQFDAEEARAAGRVGGIKVSQNRAHMAEIGRKGGEASGRSRVHKNPPTPPDLDACNEGEGGAS